MPRRKPKEFSFLETGAGKKVRGGKGVIEDRVKFFTGGTRNKLPELTHRWMSQEKRRTHKRERREGKSTTKDMD